MKHILRRIALYLLAAWVSVTLAFLLPRWMPGDPATAMFARFQGQLSPEAIVALQQAFGFTDAPLSEQYLTYLSHLARGDLGISVAHFPEPVTSVIGESLLWTLFLAGGAAIISFILGTLLGIAAAWRRGKAVDNFVPPLLVLLGSFPYFWLAMLSLFLLGFTFEWFPVRHAYDDRLEPGWTFEFAYSVLSHACLPAFTIVIATMGGWMLSMRNTMIAVLDEDYITLAHAKGLRPGRVMLGYAARNALLPNITGFGMALGYVLSGSLLTEVVFSYPGQGYRLIQAVQTLDYPLLQGLFLTITFAVLAANFLVDILYAVLDPRTR